MSLYIVASGAVAPLTAQQKKGKTGAGIAEIRPQENTFKGSCLRRDRRIRAVRIHNRTTLQAVYGRGIAEFGQSNGRADSGKVLQYEPTKHMAQCVRVPLRNIVAIATPQS